MYCRIRYLLALQLVLRIVVLALLLLLTISVVLIYRQPTKQQEHASNINHQTLLGAVHKCQHFHECTNHTLSWGYVKINIFSYTFNFMAWFLLFSWEFLALKKCWCVLFFWRGGEWVSESMVCTLIKMLTFMDSPLQTNYLEFSFSIDSHWIVQAISLTGCMLMHHKIYHIGVWYRLSHYTDKI